MKSLTLLQTVLISLTTALITTFTVLYFVQRPQSAPAEEIAGQEQLHKYLMSGRLQRQFSSTQPTHFSEAAKLSTPAVVYIESIQDQNENPFFENSKSNTGSGVLISSDGMIVSNYHVVENAEKITVLLNDNRNYEAKIIGTDPSTDLALLKIEEVDLPFLVFGNSDSLLIGEWVLAVGNPFRLQSTVTAGIVSAKARSIQILNSRKYSIESFIQTDAAVNPGNSGGALVNTAGELVGINTAIMSATGRYEGYSFSIPANLVQKVVRDIQQFGAVQRGLLGVMIQSVNGDIAKEKDLPSPNGVLITSVTPDGAADKAGLISEDVILKVEDRKVNSVPELQELIGGLSPGNRIKIEYFRNKQRYTAYATLRNQANTTELIATRHDKILTDLGFELRNLSEDEQKKTKKSGVKVISIYDRSIIAQTNMAPNFIITSANGKDIHDVDQLISFLDTTQGRVVLQGVYENYKGIFPYSFEKE
ncbi:MAG TPA: trypsin-like peptidase domain-containing protein [Saprospiraceae bacterium]|nr:trypsin-like peptidase domain-containing protein [Saprospiraceae bacterium]